MRCPSCKKEGTFRSWEGPIQVMGVQVFAHGERCRSCGETLFNEKEVERQEVEAANMLVARGIRTAAEFRFIRKVADLRANEVAEILDVRPETVSRWERGETEIPRLAAFALGELYERPRIVRQRLLAAAQ
jgi:putative zinc finger/helix-turn-helix YgiT family protein